jgi:hypothetical protein
LLIGCRVPAGFAARGIEVGDLETRAEHQMPPERSDKSRTIVALQPFVPARDFELSKAFYIDLGFQARPLGDGLVEMRLRGHSFLLQDYYVKEWASNFVMHAMVEGLPDWWAHIASLNLSSRYGVESPRAPKPEPWGLTVAYVFDPSGVLWHFAEPTARPAG